jgi:lipopolysaccharide export system permease protein
VGVTLYKYIFDEIWPTFLVSLFVAVFIILATRMLSLIELVVNKGAQAGQMGMMLLYLVPDIVVFALPAAALMAVLVAFLRLSSDSEIIAMKASGISLYQMLPPVVLLAFMAFLLALFMNGIAAPWGNRSFKDLAFQVARSRADLGIKERVFSEPFDNVMFYVNDISEHDHQMKDVFVVDRRDKTATNTIVARKGSILADPNKRSITLRFKKGTIFVIEKNLAAARTIHFDTYDLSISLQDMMAALQSRRRHASEMRIGELLEGIRKTKSETRFYYKMKIKLHEKFSVPLAVFLMGMIGVPLGARLRARGRSTGVGISLAIFLAYYVSFTGVERICETGAFAPEVGIWLPDIFLFLACVYLLRRVSRERSINIFKRAAEA